MKKWVALAIVFTLLCVTINVGVLNYRMNGLSLRVDKDNWSMTQRTEVLKNAVNTLYTRTDPQAIPNMIERALPSTVMIGIMWTNPADPNQFIGTHGSGLIIDSKRGLILTCAHVAQCLLEPNAVGAVQFYNSNKVGSVVGVKFAENSDLAVIKVNWCPAVSSAAYADPNSIRIGEPVFVIGSPLNCGTTVTTGIVSRLGAGNFDFPTIQVDAAINPGNSGGPVFNTKGEVVGLAMGVFSQNGGNVGLNVLVSAEAIRNELPAMLEALNSEN